MAKKLFIYLFLVALFINPALSMNTSLVAHVNATMKIAGDFRVPYSHTSWPYIKALWVAILFEKTSALNEADLRNELIKKSFGYRQLKRDLEVLFSTSKVSTPLNEDEHARFMQILLQKDHLILLSLEVTRGHAGEKILSYFLSPVLFTKFDVVFSSGERERWNPAEATIPFAIAAENIADVNYWLTSGFKINHRFSDYDGAPMLGIAAALNKERVATYLLSMGADRFAKDGKSRTPMMLAFEKQNMNMISLINNHAPFARSLPVEQPSTAAPSIPTAHKRNLLRAREKYFNKKYLSEKSIPSPLTMESAYSDEKSVPPPAVTFEKLKDVTPYQDRRVYEVEKQFVKTMNFRVLSKNPPRPGNSYRRNTIVIAGRRLEASVPKEYNAQNGVNDGRLLFIVPHQYEWEARVWLADDRDVVVVDKLWDAIGNEIPDEELGLVSARRLAAFHMANYYDLPDFIMLDDNIQHFYVSEYLDQKITNWPQLYHLFQKVAHAQNSTVLSAPALNHETLAESFDSQVPLVNKNAQAAKIFYFNMAKIRTKRSTARDFAWLLPLRRNVFGEDIFFQEALNYLGFSTDVFLQRTLAYTRTRTSQNAALTTLDKRFSWGQTPTVPVFAPAEHLYALRRMKEIYQTNLSRIAEQNKAKMRVNLPLLTAVNTDRRNQKRSREEVEKFREDVVRVAPKKARSEVMPFRHADYVDGLMESSTTLPDIPSNFAKALEETIDDILRHNSSLRASVDGTPFYFHQYQALLDLKNHLRAQKKTGYVELPTGAGKTRVFLTWLAMALQSTTLSQKHMAIVVPTVDLVEQTYEAMHNFNDAMRPFGLHIPITEKVIKVSTGNVSQGYLQYNDDFVDGKPHVMIFCQESFRRFLKESPEFHRDFSMIIVDEFHVAIEELLSKLSHAAKVQDLLLFGFSATPYQYVDYFSDRISYLSIEEAIGRGVLSPFESFAFDDIKSFLAAENLVDKFNTTTHPRGRLMKDMKTIIFVSRVEEAKVIAKNLRDGDLSAEVFHGDLAKSKQASLRRRFAKTSGSDRVNILVAVNMLNLGFDGNVETVIVGRRIKNVAKAFQMLGRELRLDRNDPEKIAMFIAPQRLFKDFPRLLRGSKGGRVTNLSETELKTTSPKNAPSFSQDPQAPMENLLFFLDKLIANDGALREVSN